jgi:hypothetical protein
VTDSIFKSYDPNYEVKHDGFAEYWRETVHITPHTVSDEDKEILKDIGWQESLWYFYKEGFN